MFLSLISVAFLMLNQYIHYDIIYVQFNGQKVHMFIFHLFTYSLIILAIILLLKLNIDNSIFIISVKFNNLSTTFQFYYQEILYQYNQVPFLMTLVFFLKILSIFSLFLIENGIKSSLFWGWEFGRTVKMLLEKCTISECLDLTP